MKSRPLSPLRETSSVVLFHLQLLQLCLPDWIILKNKEAYGIFCQFHERFSMRLCLKTLYDHAFKVMKQIPHHRYQVLTKRAEQMTKYC